LRSITEIKSPRCLQRRFARAPRHAALAGSALISLPVISWHEEDRFWVTVRDGVFDSVRWKTARREVDSIVRMVGLQPGQAVLDIPCGPGRHLLHFAERGFRVTGVDATRDYLREAEHRLAGLPAELICDDMRSFVRERAFDLVVNLYTSFGYFDDPRDDAQFLLNVHESLRPGGRLVLELLTRETATAGETTSCERVGDDGSHLTEWAKLSEDASAIERHFVVDRDGERLEFIAEHRLYGVRELMSLLERVGFRRVAVFGDLDGRPLTAASTFVVLIATR
jgi:SAM-dependent methyltransferase